MRGEKYRARGIRVVDAKIAYTRQRNLQGGRNRYYEQAVSIRRIGECRRISYDPRDTVVTRERNFFLTRYLLFLVSVGLPELLSTGLFQSSNLYIVQRSVRFLVRGQQSNCIRNVGEVQSVGY